MGNPLLPSPGDIHAQLDAMAPAIGAIAESEASPAAQRHMGLMAILAWAQFTATVAKRDARSAIPIMMAPINALACAADGGTTWHIGTPDGSMLVIVSGETKESMCRHAEAIARTLPNQLPTPDTESNVLKTSRVEIRGSARGAPHDPGTN